MPKFQQDTWSLVQPSEARHKLVPLTSRIVFRFVRSPANSAVVGAEVGAEVVGAGVGSSKQSPPSYLHSALLLSFQSSTKETAGTETGTGDRQVRVSNVLPPRSGPVPFRHDTAAVRSTNVQKGVSTCVSTVASRTRPCSTHIQCNSRPPQLTSRNLRSRNTEWRARTFRVSTSRGMTVISPCIHGHPVTLTTVCVIKECTAAMAEFAYQGPETQSETSSDAINPLQATTPVHVRVSRSERSAPRIEVPLLQLEVGAVLSLEPDARFNGPTATEKPRASQPTRLRSPALSSTAPPPGGASSGRPKFGPHTSAVGKSNDPGDGTRRK